LNKISSMCKKTFSTSCLKAKWVSKFCSTKFLWNLLNCSPVMMKITSQISLIFWLRTFATSWKRMSKRNSCKTAGMILNSVILRTAS
jgi:hypothetical protein